MNKAEKKRQHLETLYLKYRAGNVSLSELLCASVELDVMIARVYACRYKSKQARCKTSV